MKRQDLKQIASILRDDDPQETAYKLTTILNMPLPASISGKTAAIEQESPLFGGNGPTEQSGLFPEKAGKE